METFLHDMNWVFALRSDALTPIFRGFSWLGYITFFLIALPIGYWAWSKDKFTRLAILIFISALLNAFLKDLWQNPRPDPAFWLDHGAEGSFGMPSGHTQIGIVMWFWLAYEIKQKWAYVAAAIIASGIAFSRLYLGVHDVEDIIVGSALGFASLGLYWWFFTPTFKTWHDLPILARLGALSLALVAVFALWPEGVGQNAAAGGFLIAWMAGAAYDSTYTRFEKPAEWWKAVLFSVVGTFGMLFLYQYLVDFQEATAPDSIALTTVNGAVLGFYVTLIAPRLFQVLGLAQRGLAKKTG